MADNTRVTFMIGNGFDLSCGLKTKYTDTYELYLSAPSRTDQIKLFKEVMQSEIAQDIDTWADFEMSIAKHASIFYKKGCLFEGINDYTEFLGQYLLSQNDAFKEISRDSVHYGKGFSMLYQFYHGLPSQTESRLFSNMLERFTNSYYVLNFNYTDTIDTLLSYNPSPIASNKKIPVVHVHGTVKDGMILGVDNLEQLHLANELSEREKRAIIKPFFNQVYDDTKTESAKSLIMNSDIICIYGLSLGDSDKTWADTIVAWIKASPNHHIVAYDYQLENNDTVLANRKLDLSENSKEIFTKRLIGEIDTEVMKQIHVPVGQKLFDINS